MHAKLTYSLPTGYRRLSRSSLLLLGMLAALTPGRGDAFDDFPDVVTTGLDNVWVFLGDGEGGFAEPVELFIGPQVEAWQVTTGDIDGDRDVDIVSANRFGPHVSLHVNNGDGTFEDARLVSTNDRPYDVDLGDLDGDGSLDLVVTCNNDPGPVEIRFNNGDGSFDEVTFYFPTDGEQNPFNSAIADFDADGDLDVATTLRDSDTLRILMNDGGELTPGGRPPVGSDPKPIDSGFINDDEHVDLVITNESDATVGVLLGDGEGNFTQTGTFPAGATPRELCVADLDGDGLEDVVVAAGRGTDFVVRYLSTADGRLVERLDIPTGPRPNSVRAADFDLDGDLDLVVANWSLDNPALATMSLLLNDGDGNFPEKADFVPPGGFDKITALEIGQFNAYFFRRGDVNLDDRINVSDVIHLLRHLFAGWLLECQDAADTNDTGDLDITDGVVLLEFLFLNGPSMPPPGVGGGTDPTPDALTCNPGQ